MDHEMCKKLVNEDDNVMSSCFRLPYYPLAVKRGYGSIVEDIDGNSFIDLFSSASSLNVGHCHPKVVKAIIEQSKKFTHYSPVYSYNESLVELANKAR